MCQPRQNTFVPKFFAAVAGAMLMVVVGSNASANDMSPLASLNIQPLNFGVLNTQNTIQPSFGQPNIQTQDFRDDSANDQASADSRQDSRIILASLSTKVPSDRDNYTVNLFGSSERRYSDISAFVKWTGVLKRFKSEFSGNLNNPQVKNWMKMIGSLQNASKEEKIEAVNRYMNSIQFVDDSRNYGKSDYWATPMEFMARGGDCEDYAIAKYITLRALGFKHDEMRMAIVYDRVMRMPHALLVVYNDGQANILDNQNPDVIDQAEISRYKPIYSISQVAWWRH